MTQHHPTELLVLAESVPPGSAGALPGPGISEIAVVAAHVVAEHAAPQLVADRKRGAANDLGNLAEAEPVAVHG